MDNTSHLNLSTEDTTPVASAPVQSNPPPAPAIFLPAAAGSGVNVVKKGSGGPKIKWGKGAKAMLAGSILALVLLVGGIIGGTKLSQQPQRPKVQAGGGCCGPWDCGGGQYCAGANCQIENNQVKGGWGYCAGGENRDRSAGEIAQDYINASQGQKDGGQSAVEIVNNAVQTVNNPVVNPQTTINDITRFFGKKDFDAIRTAANLSTDPTENQIRSALNNPASNQILYNALVNTNNVAVKDICDLGLVICAPPPPAATVVDLNSAQYVQSALPKACYKSNGSVDTSGASTFTYKGKIWNCVCYNSNGKPVIQNESCTGAPNLSDRFSSDGITFNIPMGCVGVRYTCPDVNSLTTGCSGKDPNKGYQEVRGGSLTFLNNFCGTQQLDISCDTSASSFDAFKSIYTCGTTTPLVSTSEKSYCNGPCTPGGDSCNTGLSCQSRDSKNVCWGAVCEGFSAPQVTTQSNSTPTPTVPPVGPTPTPIPPGSSFQCQLIQILRGGSMITPDQIQINDNIVFRGFASATGTTVSAMLFTVTINGVAQAPVSRPATLVGGQYQADYPYTISQTTSYSASVVPVSP